MSKKCSERDRSKRFPCFYCGKLVLKLPDHLEREHQNEADVRKMVSLKLKSHERKAQISKIRARGNFTHNKKAIESGKGVIIPKRRVVELSPSKLIACHFCGETYNKTWFHKHRKTCFLRPSSSVDESEKKFRLPAARTGKFMLGSKISDETKLAFDENIINKLKPKCNISAEIKKDPLLLTFGLEMRDMLAGREDQYNYIRCKLRELGRLLIQLKEDNVEIGCLLDAIKPSHFEEIIAATLKVSGYEPGSGTFDTPSLAKRIGESLQKCASIASKDAIITGDETMRKDVADFIVLMDIDWSKRVSRKATFNLKEGKYNKETQIPDKSDVVKIVSFIENENQSVVDKLQADPTNSKLFNRLVMVTLASVIIFNRKRPGDTHKLWITTYSKSSTDNTHESIRESLTSEQKQLVDSLKRVETRGKKGRKIPILFTKKMQTSISLLLSLRDNCSVPKDNKYVFASVGTSSFVRGSDALRWCREQAGCKHPERLTATCLRKEAATLAKIAGLTEGQVEELAGFLGHIIGTHQQYYRLPESTIQTAMVSQYLCKISSTSTGDSTQDESQSYEEDMTDSDTEVEEEENTRKVKSKSKKGGFKRIATGKQKTGIPTPETRKAKNKQLWTTPQKACVYKYLSGNIDSYKLPGKKDCEKCLRDSPLKTRKCEDVKSFCRYEIQRRLKQAYEAP